jgi:N6-adenosine-specific RNA methylase IME4
MEMPLSFAGEMTFDALLSDFGEPTSELSTSFVKGERFGTFLIDPPWSYQTTTGHERLSGYSDKQYLPLTTADLCSLPVGELASSDAVLLLWATWPFISDALTLIDSWGFKFVTGLPWVKTQADVTKLAYGVGYWFRGATEPLLVAKKGKAFRNPTLGILHDAAGLVSPRLEHSRKPDDVYELAEFYPGPYLELFARRSRPGWVQLGNECPGDGQDIRVAMRGLL